MNIEKMTHTELADWLAGYSLIKLGQGESMRNIVYFIFDITLRWNVAQGKKKK